LSSDCCNLHLETFLEDDEAVDAETFVNKASSLINGVDDWALLLRYKVTYARVLDANRKFIEASVRYYELSTTTSTEVVQDDLLELLGKAVTCAILGKAGQQRTRVLGLLFQVLYCPILIFTSDMPSFLQDERVSSLDHLTGYESHHTVLSKMFKEQILKKDELVIFESSLMPHQKAVSELLSLSLIYSTHSTQLVATPQTTSDGFTIPEKAVIEHNMAATGKIYDNIHFAELGNILLLDVNRVEKVGQCYD
jgi:COP9 signalosome complex subunit 4